MPDSQLPIRALTDEEIVEFLRSHQVGRLAYAFRGHVDIVPVHYIYHDGWLYGRTSLGPKLEMLAHSHWVAFEVDEVREPPEWTSVVVHGTFRPIHSEGSDADLETTELAVSLLREVYPAAFTAGDLTPYRTILFRIHVDEATGREATLVRG
ncbi:MAG: pyridoxamine 5'-phosphate oxidase family protein [Gemmatimonadaceae bacterium]